jgi:hypothetical protein
MPTLKPTDCYGVITWLGLVADRGNSLRSIPRDRLRLGFDGPEGESHSGATRPACSRVSAQYPLGTPIRNVRQLTVLSAEEIAATAEVMGVEHLDPALLGATMVISGIPDFTHIPCSSRLQGENGATITVDMENRPCQFPAREIEAEQPGHGKLYKSAATGRRGITAWVEREGELILGERLRLHIPDQRAWAP